jgi:hypothetical protein
VRELVRESVRESNDKMTFSLTFRVFHSVLLENVGNLLLNTWGKLAIANTTVWTKILLNYQFFFFEKSKISLDIFLDSV